MRIMMWGLALALALSLAGPRASAQASTTTTLTELRDGQHDWDTQFGTWQIHLHKRLHPLTGSNEWGDFVCHDETRRVWGGMANLDELEADGPTGHIEGLTLRLYNPKTHQWSIYWANAADPEVGVPMIGSFAKGRGEFYDQEMYHDRSIYVRYLWTNMTDNSGDFEQAFSADGGKTWEPNWVTTMEHEPPGRANVRPNPDIHDGQHDFDYAFGLWNVHLKRLANALGEHPEWREYDGTVNVTKFWNGRGNIAEVKVKNGTSQLQGVSLRLFDPRTRQWSIYFANAADGILDLTPLVGNFQSERGQFYAFEKIAGQWVMVRFIFSGTKPNNIYGEQAFSKDGGKTWAPNWIIDMTRAEAKP